MSRKVWVTETLKCSARLIQSHKEWMYQSSRRTWGGWGRCVASFTQLWQFNDLARHTFFKKCVARYEGPGFTLYCREKQNKNSRGELHTCSGWNRLIEPQPLCCPEPSPHIPAAPGDLGMWLFQDRLLCWEKQTYQAAKTTLNPACSTLTNVHINKSAACVRVALTVSCHAKAL